MEYQDVVRDFARRTLSNLEAIEDLAEEQEASRERPTAFEVTQLVNSMLGLIIFPREEYVDRISLVSLADLGSKGWPIPRATGHFSKPPKNLRDLIKFMRNSVAHFNVEFLIDPQTREISGVKLWNLDKSNIKTWEAELDVEELRKLAVNFVDLMIENRHA